MWLSLAFLSALLLGAYDTCKKSALNGNAVIPVLLLNTIFCSLLFLPLIVLSVAAPDTLRNTIFFVPPADLYTHLHIFLKSCIVLSSWLFAYFATKHLPITIAAPIKASQPILTLIGALLFFGEALNLYQWIGVCIAIIAFILLSLTGKKEGINFRHNIWILFIILATITGALSGLYDKYLMSHGFHRMTVLVWYSYYQMALMLIIAALMWYPKRHTTTPFVWRKSIFFISLFLVCADFVYFYALSYPESMISIVSMVRRSSVVVSFTAGAILFREKNIGNKTIDLVLVLLGMLFLYLGTR
ncbi:MAG: EamA family transporter [Bacteroidaceae bacterium]|nr:EamA family transporter [Bacteroidales bacterium]MBP3671828.1 EamA family transporter [Bacteroidaceae bacterium]MBQ2980386.1 EamA family transporter [Bacteroidaceae bacterium]